MRVLQIGYGQIGREVFTDYHRAFDEGSYMVYDRAVASPAGHEWDRRKVDLAVLLVDTPPHALGFKSGEDGLDYRDLCQAVYKALEVAEFILIRSTIGVGFLQTTTYSKHAEMIGFAPEFYGATKWSKRGQVDLDFSIFTHNVPEWFVEKVSTGEVIRVSPLEAAIAKLAENAYLATKVTFFHELYLLCEQQGADFEAVRRAVTADPRINPYHTAVEELGWQSHCFDKDVPAFAQLSRTSGSLVASAIAANSRLLHLREQRNSQNDS